MSTLLARSPARFVRFRLAKSAIATGDVRASEPLLATRGNGDVTIAYAPGMCDASHGRRSRESYLPAEARGFRGIVEQNRGVVDRRGAFMGHPGKSSPGAVVGQQWQARAIVLGPDRGLAHIMSGWPVWA